MDKIYGRIYCVTNVISGKCYIGQTVATVRRRWQIHSAAANGGSKLPLHCAIVKYGGECFVVTEIATASTREELDRLEIAFIASRNTLVPAGYNVAAGGGGVSGSTAAARRKGQIRGTYQRHASAEQLALRAAAVRTAKNDPHWKARFMNVDAQRWSNPIWRSAILAARQAARLRPDVAATRSAIAKRLWADPEYRARRGIGHAEKVKAGIARAKAARSG
jgi:group I intron endonuclease